MKLLKQNKRIKIKSIEALKKNKNLKKRTIGFIDKSNVILTNEMLSLKEIKIQENIVIEKNCPIFFGGYWWYPWMLEDTMKKIDIE